MFFSLTEFTEFTEFFYLKVQKPLVHGNYFYLGLRSFASQKSLNGIHGRRFASLVVVILGCFIIIIVGWC